MCGGKLTCHLPLHVALSLGGLPVSMWGAAWRYSVFWDRGLRGEAVLRGVSYRELPRRGQLWRKQGAWA